MERKVYDKHLPPKKDGIENLQLDCIFNII